jgi:hypothetical protein
MKTTLYFMMDFGKHADDEGQNFASLPFVYANNEVKKILNLWLSVSTLFFSLIFLRLLVLYSPLSIY